MRKVIAAIAALVLMCAGNPAEATSCAGMAIFFVNGINNSPDAAQKSRDRLALATEEGGEFAADGRKFYVNYNNTGKGAADLIESLYQKASTYETRTGVAAIWGYGAATEDPSLLRDAPNGFTAFAETLVSAVVQAFSTSTVQYQADLARHVKAIQAARVNGDSLVMIGHSQGALFVNDELFAVDQSVTDPVAHEKFKSSTSGYFVAPAAASYYGGFVKGYTKLNTDLLAVLGIGFPGNLELFENDAEKQEAKAAAAGDAAPDFINHSFLLTYLNDDMAAKSAAYARVKATVVAGIKAAIAAAEKPCGWAVAMVMEHNEDVMFWPGNMRAGMLTLSAQDPLLLRDVWSCRANAYYPGLVGTFNSREECMSAIGGKVVAPVPGNLLHLTSELNWNGVCNMAPGPNSLGVTDLLTCGWDIPNPNAIYAPDLPYFDHEVAALSGPMAMKCEEDEVLHAKSDGTSECLGWTAVMSLLQ